MIGNAPFAVTLIAPAEGAVALCMTDATAETLHFAIARRPDGLRRAADFVPEGKLRLSGAAGVTGVFRGGRESRALFPYRRDGGERASGRVPPLRPLSLDRA